LLSQVINIAIVDDDDSVREALVALIQSHGYIGRAFASAASFLVSEHRPEIRCLVADMHMPGMSGLDLARVVADFDVAIPTILISARYDEGVRVQALKAGIRCTLAKPFNEADLLGCIHAALAENQSPDQLSDTKT
jgi:FixJ family two-component response regulator